MSLITVNGYPATSAFIYLPRVGIWHARVVVDTSGLGLDGAVVIASPTAMFQGTARQGGVSGDSSYLSVVGGAGGFNKPVSAKYYRDVPLSIPLADLLGEIGERLSPTAVTTARLDKWVRPACIGAQAISSMMAYLGLVWRVLPDGTVWCGSESWNPATLQYDVLRDSGVDENMLTIASEYPELLPGTALNGRYVSYVIHRMTPEALRSDVWFEQPA